MDHRIAEVLERQYVNVRQRGFNDLPRDGFVGLVAVPQNQVVGVMTPNGIVGCPVVGSGQPGEFLAARFGLQEFGVEDRSAPGIVGPCVHPCRTVAIEISDEIAVFAQFGAVRARDVVDPFPPLRTQKVEVTGVLLPLVRFRERQQMAKGHVQGPVLVIRK